MRFLIYFLIAIGILSFSSHAADEEELRKSHSMSSRASELAGDEQSNPIFEDPIAPPSC